MSQRSGSYPPTHASTRAATRNSAGGCGVSGDRAYGLAHDADPQPGKATPSAQARTRRALNGVETSAGPAPGHRPVPGVTGPAARHGCGPAPLPGKSPVSRRDGHRPPTERRKERTMS